MAEAFTRVRRLLALRGRCSRAINLWFQLACFGSWLAAILIWTAVGLPLWPAIIVLAIVFFAIGLMFSIRRLHDVGLSGWFVLLNPIPILGWIFAWSVIFKRGQVGPNRYGDDPLKLKARRPSRPGLEWALAVLGSLAVLASVFSFRIFAFQPFTTPGGSMEPTLAVGDDVIVSKFAYGFSKYSVPFSPPLFQGRVLNRAPHRGDVIVFKLPRNPRVEYIQRLIGIPGDRIQIKSGVVFVNNRAMGRDQVAAGRVNMSSDLNIPVKMLRETTPEGRNYMTQSTGSDGATENTGVYVVPSHCYFMLGDNRDDSLDSRFDPNMQAQAKGPSNCGWDTSVDAYVPADSGVGFVPEENLVGRAVVAVALTDKPRFRWLDAQ